MTPKTSHQAIDITGSQAENIQCRRIEKDHTKHPSQTGINESKLAIVSKQQSGLRET